MREVLAKAFIPKAGISRAKQYALSVGQIATRQKLRVDLSSIVRNANHSRWPNQNLQRQRINLVCALNKMRRRIDVRSCVRAKMKKGNVRRITVRERRPGFNIQCWIAFINRHAAANGNCDVVSWH